VILVDAMFKIYIKKSSVVFSHLGFHVKLLYTLYLWLYVDDIVNEIVSDKLLII
jgi:hypothetical protein